jgi:hypothetical protein
MEDQKMANTNPARNLGIDSGGYILGLQKINAKVAD